MLYWIYIRNALWMIYAEMYSFFMSAAQTLEKFSKTAKSAVVLAWKATLKYNTQQAMTILSSFH